MRVKVLICVLTLFIQISLSSCCVRLCPLYHLHALYRTFSKIYIELNPNLNLGRSGTDNKINSNSQFLNLRNWPTSISHRKSAHAMCQCSPIFSPVHALLRAHRRLRRARRRVAPAVHGRRLRGPQGTSEPLSTR